MKPSAVYDSRRQVSVLGRPNAMTMVARRVRCNAAEALQQIFQQGSDSELSELTSDGEDASDNDYVPIPHVQRYEMSHNYHVSDADEESDEVEVNENSGESGSDNSSDGEHAVQERGRDRSRGCCQAPGLGQAPRRGLGRRENIVPPVANHDEMTDKK